MPGLLDYIIQDYQTGGYVNPFDPSAVPTQEDIFGQYDIELTDDKFKPFIPTYDKTGEDFLRTNYMQDRQGLYSGGRSALGQLGQKSSQTSAQQGFAGMGKSLLDTTRGDIVDEFGRQSQKAWTGLQQDIYGRRKDYEEDVLGAIGDLDESAYTVGADKNEVDVLPTEDVGNVWYNGAEFQWSEETGEGGAYLPVSASGGTTTLGYNPDNPPPGGQNTDANAPWNQPGYNPSDHETGESWYNPADGKNYIFDADENSWLWDGF